MPDPNCSWCHGTGFFSEEDLSKPWDAEPHSAGVNCKVCNPVGTARPLTETEMAALVARQHAAKP